MNNNENLKPLKIFYQKVDLRNKKEMIQFLTNHFRYNTMSSWNNSTSYANKVKIWDVIPSSIQDKVFELMEAEGFYNDISWILQDWDTENDWKYQAGFNGRSGGYIVMYEGFKKTKYFIKPDATFNHLSGEYCDKLGRWFQKEEAEQKGLIGKTYIETSTYSGRSIDQREDFEDWSMSQLKERVQLVQSFDKMCDHVVLSVIQMASENEVIEETIMIPKKIKTIVPHT